MRIGVKSALCAVGALGVGAAHGQVFFEDEAGWAAAGLTAPVLPNYDAIPPQLFDLGDTVFVDENDEALFTVTVATNGGAFDPDFDSDFNAAGNFVFDFDPLTTVTFTFDVPITGFGALWSNTFVEDGFSASSPTTEYELNNIAATNSAELSSTFIGIQEPAGFTTVTFSTTDPDIGEDFVFFTDFQWTRVPAPGSAALLAVVGVVGVRRRR